MPTSLAARLVAVAVLLVTLVGLLVTVATALAMHGYLTSQLDADLRQSLSRERGGDRMGNLPCPADNAVDDSLPRRGDRGLPPGQGAGTLTVRADCAWVLDRDRDARAITVTDLTRLAAVPTDGRPHSVELRGYGDYRVISTGTSLTGLPSSPVENSVRNLVLVELGLTAMGVVLAGLIGRTLVSRQLRPLREVAASAHDAAGLELASGEPERIQRVPADYTDPRTEVGQVGQALNTLLDHVDAALGARHASEQQVRQFVADASHELRTPLATIRGYAELSRRTPDDAAQLASALHKVETETGRMSALVEDLLLLARLDSGRPLRSDEVDLTHLALEAVADARVVAPDHRWRLELPEEPVVVLGDEQRLHQAVTNLLNNARAHTPPGTVVTVALRPEKQGWTQIVVADDGPGLPKHLTAHAFERFTRGDSSRTRSSGGAGLGLSLVQAILHAHGGRAEVDSSPGATEFRLVLPH